MCWSSSFRINKGSPLPHMTSLDWRVVPYLQWQRFSPSIETWLSIFDFQEFYLIDEFEVFQIMFTCLSEIVVNSERLLYLFKTRLCQKNRSELRLDDSLWQRRIKNTLAGLEPVGGLKGVTPTKMFVETDKL